MSFAPVTNQSAVEESGGEYFPGTAPLLSHCNHVHSFLDHSGIKKIEYRPDAPVNDVLCFKYYNAQEVGRRVGVNAAVEDTPFSFPFGQGRAWSNYGGLAEVLCLLLAHFQGHWLVDQ